jgi:hypothetical protein
MERIKATAQEQVIHHLHRKHWSVGNGLMGSEAVVGLPKTS